MVTIVTHRHDILLPGILVVADAIHPTIFLHVATKTDKTFCAYCNKIDDSNIASIDTQVTINYFVGFDMRVFFLHATTSIFYPMRSGVRFR